MNHQLQLDQRTRKSADLFAPEMNMFGLSSLDDPGESITLPKPVAATFANWMDAVEQVDPDIRNRMSQFV